VPAETVERLDELPVRHGGETEDPTVDSDHGVLRHLGEGDLPLCLSGEVTAVRFDRDGDDFEDAFMSQLLKRRSQPSLGRKKRALASSKPRAGLTVQVLSKK
jgi:hypothetical protein